MRLVLRIPDLRAGFQRFPKEQGLTLVSKPPCAPGTILQPEPKYAGIAELCS